VSRPATFSAIREFRAFVERNNLMNFGQNNRSAVAAPGQTAKARQESGSAARRSSLIRDAVALASTHRPKNLNVHQD
jgi:hypothetical protein